MGIIPGQPVGAARDPLTDRELEILQLLADGLSNREIAQELVITYGTVKWYNKQIYSKLGVHSRAQAVARARETGQLDRELVTPALKEADSKHKLPAPVSSFVGRERELAEAKRLLANTRLLTLSGPPGTGKTRLGLQVASEVLDGFEDGVFFVDLAPISDPQLVASRIAQVLDIKEVAGKPLKETLQNYLHSKQLLLLLDNFEHILDAAPLAGDLLSAAPRLKILVTSREILQIYGEQEYTVPPLALPDLERADSLRALSHYEAVELFVQRARAVKSDFRLTEENAQAVAEICVRLDGLPLAIELAAARVRLLSSQDLSARLENRFAVLKGGMRNVPPRQQTLQATIDWSYHLLDEDEKTLLARLGVFQGGRSVEAAEAVCGPGLSIDVLDGLESLLTKSLLWQGDSPDGEPRFFMLETVHEYARERLEGSGEAQDLHRRHAEYFVALAEQAGPELQGARPGYWYGRLKVEQDNLRIALAWSLEDAATGDLESGLRLVCALRDFWYFYGYIAEGLKWTERTLEKAGDVPSTLRAGALNAAGMLAYYGDHERGKISNREALALSRELGDKGNQAWALVWLGAHSAGHPEEYQAGTALCEEGLTLFRELNDKLGMAWALNMLGELARLGGDYERAGMAYEESLAISRQIGAKLRGSLTHDMLAFVAQHQGDYDRAEAIFLEGLALAQELGSKHQSAYSLALLAGPVGAKGQPKRAARLLGASEAIFEAWGVGPVAADKPELDRYLAAARAQLDEAAFKAAWAEGRAMSLEEAVAYALHH
jgi:non-specific serine/threonine protein kinase